MCPEREKISFPEGGGGNNVVFGPKYRPPGSSRKSKFILCPFFDQETNGSYPFANGLNGLADLSNLPVPLRIKRWRKNSVPYPLNFYTDPEPLIPYHNFTGGSIHLSAIFLLT
jgi:hypothetical protein